MIDGDLFTDDDLPSWYRQAACTDVPTDLFFPGSGRGGPDEAVAVCQGCPVRGDCLAYALEQGIEHGVWGGTSERQRVALARRPRAA